MPTFSRAFMRTASLPSLLATTSVAALLLATPARAQTTPGVVTNPVPVNGTFTIDANTVSVVVDQPSFTGDIVNPSFLPLNTAAQLSGTNTGIAIRSTSFNGSVTNAGQISVNVLQNGTTPAAALRHTIGIAIGPSQNGGSGGTFSGNVINSGSIIAFGGFVRGLDPNTLTHIAGRPILPDFAPGIGIEVQETVTGSIVNTGAGGFANDIFVGNFGGTGRLLPFANRIPFQSVPGVIDVNAPVLGGIKNAGFISATSAVAIHSTAAIPGGITNTGFIGVDLLASAFGITAAGIVASGPLQGAIANSGTIAASNGGVVGDGVAIDVSQVTTPTTITQTAGQILGSVILSGNADRLVISGGGVGGSVTAPSGSAAGVTLFGGVLVFGPNFIGTGLSVQGNATPDRASDLAFIKQTGGTLVLQVNNTTTAGSFPTVTAGDIALTSVAAAGQSGAFAAGSTLVFPKIITATGTLADNAPSNLPVFGFFSNALTAKLVQDGGNSLDLVFSNTGTTAVTPGVANGNAFTGDFLNPAGAKLLAISVTNGSNITGTIRNDGLVPEGITVANSTLAGSLINTGLVFGGIGVSGLVTGNGSTAGGVSNSGIVVPAHSFAPTAVLQLGVPIFPAAGFGSANAFSTDIRVVAAPSFTGNIANSGFLLAGNGIFADGGPIVGSITNSGQIFTTGGNLNFPTLDEFIAGTPASGTSPGIELVGIRVGSGPLAGGVTNTGDIQVSGNGISVSNFGDLGVGGAVGIGVIGSVGGAVGLNTGDLDAGNTTKTGVNTAARQTITGDIVNSGTIEVSASRQPIAIGIDVAATGLFAGNVRNSGSITATGLGFSSPGLTAPGFASVTTAQINQAIADNGGVENPVIVMLEAGVPKGRAVGIQIGATGLNEGQGGVFKGAVVNSGTITAIGLGVSSSFNANIVVLTTPVSGIGIATNVPILGGITNTGTITGSTASIDLTQEVGGSTVINQAGGALIGNVNLSANADILNFSGGTIFNAVTAAAGNQDLVLITGQGANFAPASSVSGVSAFTVSPNARLTLQVTQTQAPSISANAITLGGTLTLAPQGINPFALATTPLVFKDVLRLGHADPRSVCQCECKLRDPLLRGPLARRHDAKRARCDARLEPLRPRGERARFDAKPSPRPRCTAPAHASRARSARGEWRCARRECVARPGLGCDRCGAHRPRQRLGARRGSVRQRLGFGRGAGLRREPRRPSYRRRRLAPRQRHRGGGRGDLCGLVRRLQGRLAHQCQLLPGRGLRGLGRRAVVRARQRSRELRRFRHGPFAHALRPSGRRDLVTLGPKLSRPCRGRLPLGASGRRHQRLRHALRRARLCARAYRCFQRDGRLRRAFREWGGRQFLRHHARGPPDLAHRAGE